MLNFLDRAKPYANKLFDRHKNELDLFNDFETLYIKLSDAQKQQVCLLSITYDFVCEPANRKSSAEEGWIRDDIRLIGTISIIEKIMESKDYQPFHLWLESRIETLPKEGIKKAYKALFMEYNNEFGLTKKVKTFFSKYLTEKEQKEFLNKVQIIEQNGKKTIFNNFDDFGGFLYSLRSAFIHSAKLIGFFCPTECAFSGLSLNNKHYISEIHIDSYLDIFEKVFVRHWINTAANSALTGSQPE